MASEKSSVAGGFLWRFAERCGAQGVTFVVSVLLARLLEPAVYGTVALVTVFTGIMQVFVDSGLGNALIQKKNADKTDFSSVFYFNIAMCSVLYVLMFLASPLIAGFYGQPELTPLVRVLSLTLIISGVKNVQQAYVTRNMMFRKFFFSTLGGTIAAAVVGIIMAYTGFGVWALVAQNLVNQLIDTVILCLTVKWRPTRDFSVGRLKGLFGFGWKMLVSGLIDTVYNDIRQLIIGKKYSSEDLAFYNKGRQFPNLVVTNINTSVDSVLFPAMSDVQDDRERVKDITRRAIKLSSYVMWPLMVGLAVCAAPLVRLILTEKWMACVPFLRIFCIAYVFRPIHTANLNAIKALGRSDLFLKLEIMKKIVGLTAVGITMWFGVMPMALSLIATSVINQIINSWPNRSLLGYKYTDQISDILPSILLSAVMGAAVYCVSLAGLGDIPTLAIQVPLGAAIYIIGSRILKLRELDYITNTIKKLFKVKRSK